MLRGEEVPTMLQCYSIPMLQCYNATMYNVQCYNQQNNVGRRCLQCDLISVQSTSRARTGWIQREKTSKMKLVPFNLMIDHLSNPIYDIMKDWKNLKLFFKRIFYQEGALLNQSTSPKGSVGQTPLIPSVFIYQPLDNRPDIGLPQIVEVKEKCHIFLKIRLSRHVPTGN